jgi:tetratricopeptide (TPR) repeat protein
MPISPSINAAVAAVAALMLLSGCAATPAGRAATDAEAPADAETLLAQADAALERRELPEAARAYRRAAEASDDEAVAEQAARAAFELSQYEETLLAANRWLALNPTSEQARRFAGVAALELHRLDEAEAQFASLVETGYISPAAGFLALLPVLSEHGSPPDVTELFRRLSARHPKVAEGHYVLSAAALRSENHALGLASARRATEIAPYWVPARMMLARALVVSGEEEAGLAAARDLVLAPGADVATQLEYALLLAGTGRDEEARAMLTPFATGERVAPGAVRALGVLALQRGDLDEAARRFEDLLSTGTQSFDALYFLGVVADRRGDAAGAQRYWTRVTGGEHALQAQGRVARALAASGGLDAGLAHLEEFARGHPQRGPDMVAARAGLASSLGDTARTIEILDAGLAQYPDSFDLRMARVFAYERAGRDDAAVRELRKLLEQRPGDAVVQNALGYTLADRNRQLEEADALVSAALAQTPDSAAVLDSMGWVRFRQGRLPEALEYLRRAQSLGEDAEIELHVGEVQWAAGDQAAARATWRAALERWPDDARLKERLQRAGP